MSIQRHAQIYQQARRITFKQRLALQLGAKQNQRPAVFWP